MEVISSLKANSDNRVEIVTIVSQNLEHTRDFQYCKWSNKKREDSKVAHLITHFDFLLYIDLVSFIFHLCFLQEMVY